MADEDGLGTVSYQWYANDVLVSGATASSLLLGQADVGKSFKVKISYTDGFGQLEYITSNPSDVVQNVNDLPVGGVTISGLAVQGQTLTANTSALQDEDGLGTFSYVWFANGTAITNATGSTLTLAQAQVGKTISVKVQYTDQQGTIENVLSLATASVANVNDAPTGAVTILSLIHI